jgi:hypothetical protein
MVRDGADNILIAITDATGGGIAVLDLTSMSESAPLPYMSDAAQRPGTLRVPVSEKPTAIARHTGSGPVAGHVVPLWQIPHESSSILQQVQR